MAILRIYPEKDTSIYSELPTSNTGNDEILEIAGYTDASSLGRTARTLVLFNTDEINQAIAENIGNSPVSASINLFLAEASELPVNFSIQCFPSSKDWDNGIGKFGDSPVDLSGVSWTYTKAGKSLPWTTSGFSINETGSFISGQEGGGNWYTLSDSVNVTSSLAFNTKSSLDLKVDVSTAIDKINSGSLENNGFIIKLQDNLEFNTTSSISLKYFSSDTETIYPPYLELVWDDFTYNTGSLQVLNNSNPIVTVSNLRETLTPEGKYRFRLSSRPKFPVRQFSTSSIYLTNYALPQNSYWAIKDEYTGDYIFDFNKYTKISCDERGSYFDVYFNTVQPERYYRILIKTEIDGSNYLIEGKNIFKVIRNG